MTAQYKKDFLINLFFVVSILALIVFVSKYLLAYFFPFIIGVGVAFAVQKPAEILSGKFRLKKQICALVFAVILCAVFLAVLVLGVWALGSRLALLITDMPKYFADFADSLNSIENDIIDNLNTINSSHKNQFEDFFTGALGSITSSGMNFISNFAGSLLKNLPAFLISSIVTVVASCYIAKDFDRLKNFTAGLMPKEKVKILSDIKNVFIINCLKFIKGYGIIALITFFELSLAFSIIGINNPVAKAAIISVVDALPVLGVGTVLIPWAIIEMLKHNFYLGVTLAFVYLIIVIVRNFIEPKIIGGQMGINPIFTLLSMFLGLKISGVFGMILFPLSLTVFIEYYRKTIILQ